MNERLTKAQASFIAWLTHLEPDRNRGTLAELRRGLSGDPGLDIGMRRHVAPRVPEEDRRTRREAIYYLVAALYGLHPLVTDSGNFGAHLRLAAISREDMDAAERRFTALLNTRLEDLHIPLRQGVNILKQPSRSIPVNWYALFADLLYWESPLKTVQRSWANSFWAYVPAEAGEADADIPEQSEPESIDE